MANIELVIHPRKVITWETFCREANPFSIALDGYVYGRPRYDKTGPRLNLNHHEEVDRSSTLSTSGQTQMRIKAQRLFSRFQQDGEPFARLYVNDPDQDTSLSIWQFQNHERLSDYKSEPLINRLIYAENQLDITSGTYPFDPNSDLMRDIAWIYEPYTSVRSKVPIMDEHEMRNVIDAVCLRITKYSLGQGGKATPDTRFNEMHKGTGWSLVREIGPYARMGLTKADILTFVLYRGELPPGNHVYSLGKLSEFIEWPLEDLYPYLNSIEGIPKDSTDRWGGGDLTGGSPRDKGSSLPPDVLFGTIEEFLKKR